MRLPRFRIRTMMVAVAMVALVAWGGIEFRRLSRLSEFYKVKILVVQDGESRARTRVAEAKRDVGWATEMVRSTERRLAAIAHDPESTEALRHSLATEKRIEAQKLAAVRHWTAIADYFTTLKLKYWRAASHPWERVVPDPPPPSEPDSLYKPG